MSRFHRCFLALCLTGVLLTLGLGCAGKALVKENETLKADMAQLREEIESLTEKCQQEKGVLQSQVQECEEAKKTLEGSVKGLRGNLERLQADRQRAIEAVMASEEKKRSIITLPGRIFFDKGKFAIKESMKPVLTDLARQIRRYPNQLAVIAGYTCNLSTHSFRYATNWELSSLRATQVLRYLIGQEKLPPQQLCAIGFGEYYPRSSNTTEEKREENRRVEVLILSEEITDQITK